MQCSSSSRALAVLFKLFFDAEIMVFNSDAIDGKSYNYVEPSTYVSCNEVTDLRPDVIYESPVRVDNAKYNE